MNGPKQTGRQIAGLFFTNEITGHFCPYVLVHVSLAQHTERAHAQREEEQGSRKNS
jgi:hypothetical protein